ncbi:MAG: glycosyltransferase family 2 protein, partial [Halobacteriaceae archaeon]
MSSKQLTTLSHQLPVIMDAPTDIPLVSIVTPSYNQGEFIEETLKCIKNQTYENIEHIVVDGSSTDETIDILKQYEDQYNLRWISEPDEGQSDAINKGFDMANGTIIGWLNSDDLYFRDSVLSDVVNTFAANSEAAIVYGDAIFVDAEGQPLFVRKRKYWRNSRFLRGWTIPQPAIFFRQEVIDKHAIDQSLEYTMDQEFWLRIFNDYKSTYLDEILAVDRLHEQAKRLASDPEEFNAELRQ